MFTEVKFVLFKKKKKNGNGKVKGNGKLKEVPFQGNPTLRQIYAMGTPLRECGASTPMKLAFK